MNPRTKLWMTVQAATRVLACGLLACSMLFGYAGCAGGEGDAGQSVDAARGTGDDNPVVDDSAGDAAAGGDTTTQ